MNWRGLEMLLSRDVFKLLRPIDKYGQHISTFCPLCELERHVGFNKANKLYFTIVQPIRMMIRETYGLMAE